MTKKEIKDFVECINSDLLAECEQKITLMNISPDYTCNKAIAITDKDNPNKGWFGTSYKYCYKTWAEIEAFIDGFCKCKNTTFNERER